MAAFHYLLWGWALSRDTAGEREEAELAARAEEELHADD
jgi:hypothetical protein